MNVLILTPDRVGSTLLQRLLTVYMNLHEFDKPVINLHELTNGLQRYYHQEFNREVVGRVPAHGTGYFQSLTEITKMLKETDHYKTSRLAHYHIRNRNDSQAEQVPFYQYLNENYFVIACRRKNLLEHALSWGIANETKKLNVYSAAEKIDTFHNMYRQRIRLDPGIVINYIFQYKAYLDWVENTFNVNSYFNYEDDVPRIEEYILNLNIFRGQTNRIGFEQCFDIKFTDWNRCHYLTSDLSGLGHQLPAPEKQLQIGYNSTVNSMSLQSISREQVPINLSKADQDFLLEQGPAYVRAQKAIQELVARRVMVTSVPIKLQTMLEKRLLIENFDEIVAVYNQYMLDPNSKICGLGEAYTTDKLDQDALDEIKQWHQPNLLATS